MGSFNLPLFILIIILSIIVSILLKTFTDLSLWLAIPVAPILSYIVLMALSVIIEKLEPKPEAELTTVPAPEATWNLLLSLRPDALLCPSCGSDRIMEIIYGLPPMTQRIQDELDKKTIILGGCIGDKILSTGNVPAETLKKLEWAYNNRDIDQGALGEHDCEVCNNHTDRGEILIIDGEIMYVTPRKIVHYIKTHSYLPPEEFLLAVDKINEI